MRPASESQPPASWVAGGARSAESGAPVPSRIVDPPCLRCLALGSFARFSKAVLGSFARFFEERRGSSVGRGFLDPAPELDRRSQGAADPPILDRSPPLDRRCLSLGSFGRFFERPLRSFDRPRRTMLGSFARFSNGVASPAGPPQPGGPRPGAQHRWAV